jgi:hypothetical protein
MKSGGNLGRRGLPDWSFPGLLQIINRIIDRAMRQLPQLCPIVGVECFLGESVAHDFLLLSNSTPPLGGVDNRDNASLLQYLK